MLSLSRGSSNAIGKNLFYCGILVAMNQANRRRTATCLYSMAVDRLDASLADLAAATEIHPVRVERGCAEARPLQGGFLSRLRLCHFPSRVGDRLLAGRGRLDELAVQLGPPCSKVTPARGLGKLFRREQGHNNIVAMCHSISIDGRLYQSPAATDCEELPPMTSSSHFR
jgi:hypothetical protein